MLFLTALKYINSKLDVVFLVVLSLLFVGCSFDGLFFSLKASSWVFSFELLVFEFLLIEQKSEAREKRAEFSFSQVS